ncbi:MAG: pyridoxamine 5'-phosphate oxidase family protein, partial [Bacillota bacterium]|nr:pyridoxamine 5'-phosphate oxidase family protein [Bacillota bacterium]
MVYESRYGFTKEVGEALGRILGPSKLITADEFPEYKDKFQFFIIGSPVYCDMIDKRIVKLLLDNKVFLKDKNTACYLTSPIGKTAELYLKPFKEILDSSFKWIKVIYKCENCRKQIGKYGLELKEIRDSLETQLDNNVLKEEMDKFLLSHNTLSLTTGSSLGLRSTPIEYSFIKGNIYLFSEGGEKFAHLLLSDKVCISIYDNYTGFNKLNGMQIKGKAEILD